MKNWKGTIDYVSDGPSPFTMEGTASHLGRFSAVGEVTLVPVDESGLLLGAGVVVFTSANGDLLDTEDFEGSGERRGNRSILGFGKLSHGGFHYVLF